MSAKLRESITGYVGPMFAKKTLLMLHDVLAAEAVGVPVMVIKPSIDNRFAQDEVRSRAGGAHFAYPIPISRPKEIIKLVECQPNRVELVAIDEIQFFDPKIASVVLQLAENGTQVVFSGLNRDYRGNPFKTMEKVLPLASDLTVVEARCMYPINGNKRLCGSDAEMTQRLINGQPDSYNSPTVIIEKPGTSITYQARCLEHWQVQDMPTRRRTS